MNRTMSLWTMLPLLCLSGCAARVSSDGDTLTSMQVIDRNGFSETISGKDRLAQYKQVDYLAPQPYQKVLRVFGKNKLGKSSSKITSYHPNGEIWQYLEVAEGRAHGAYKEWHPNGKIKIEVAVIEGIADIGEIAQTSWIFDGKSVVWDEEGRLVAEFFYDKGQLQETARYYHPNGVLWKELPYKNNELEGPFTVYNQQGEIIEKILYQKGLKEGMAFGPGYTEEYELGSLKNGSYYNPQGALVAEVKQGQGKKALFQEGCLHSFLEYQKGIQEGVVELFDAEGHLYDTFVIKEGKKTGEELVYYHPSASERLIPKLSIAWHEDVIQGVVKTWYENGVMESQREVNRNKKHGLSFAWYKGGEVMFMEEYDQDTLQKGTYFKKGDKSPVSKVEEGRGIATIYNGDGHFLQKITYEKGKPSDLFRN